MLRYEAGAAPEAVRMLRVRGDSMEPELSEGDRLLVDTARRRPATGEMFVLWDGGGLVVKRVEYVNPGTGAGAGDTERPAMPPHASARDARTLQAAYYAMIELIDDQVGRVLDALRESGQADDTLVIFTSDHGEMLGDHGLIQKGCRFYDGLVRVPLILSWPGRIRASQQSDALVELTDLAPTLLEAAGEPVPDWMQGRSLLPMGTGSAPLDRHRDAVWCEYFDALDAPDATRATMYRRGRHKLVVYHGHGLGELYDLERDPGEFDNLWDDPHHAALKADLLLDSYAAAMAAVDVGTRRVGPM